MPNSDRVMVLVLNVYYGKRRKKSILSIAVINVGLQRFKLDQMSLAF